MPVCAAEIRPGSPKVGRVASKRMLQTTGDWRLRCLLSDHLALPPDRVRYSFSRLCQVVFGISTATLTSGPYWQEHVLLCSSNSFNSEWVSIPDGKFPKFMGFILHYLIVVNLFPLRKTVMSSPVVSSTLHLKKKQPKQIIALAILNQLKC